MSDIQIGSERWFYHKANSNHANGPFTLPQLFDEASSNSLTVDDVVTLAGQLRDYSEWHTIASSAAKCIEGFILTGSGKATIHLQVDPLEAVLSFLLPPLRVFCDDSEIWSGNVAKGGHTTLTLSPKEYTFSTVLTQREGFKQACEADTHYYFNVTPTWWSSSTGPIITSTFQRPVAAGVQNNLGYNIPFPQSACLTNRLHDHRRFFKCSACLADLSLAFVEKKKKKRTAPKSIPTLYPHEMQQVLAIIYTRRFIYECASCGERFHDDVVDEWVP